MTEHYEGPEAGIELDKQVAVRVMGWQDGQEVKSWVPQIPGALYGNFTVRVTARIDDNFVGLLTTDHHSRDCRDWSPSRNPADTLMVLDELGRRGWWCRMISPFDPDSGAGLWWAGFTPHSTTGWNGRPDHQAGGETLALAICRAALLVVEYEQTRVAEERRKEGELG